MGFPALLANKSVQMDTNVGGCFFGASYIHKLPETFVSILHTEMSLLFLKVNDYGRQRPIVQPSLVDTQNGYGVVAKQEIAGNRPSLPMQEADSICPIPLN